MLAASSRDVPPQFRITEIVDNGNGTGSIYSTVVDAQGGAGSLHELGLVLALACLGGDVLADAAGDYQALFGKRARTAAATRSTKDDAELAAAMVEAAGSLGDRRDLQVLLYEKAADFGSRDPAGCEVATRALGKLMGLVPARQAEWRDKLLDVYQFRYKRSGRSERAEAGELLVEQFLVVADAALADGDAAKANSLYRRALPVAAAVKSPRRKEISDRIKAATARLAVQRRRRGLEFRLKANPDDPRLREALIRLHVLDRDDPRTAAELVTADVDEVLRTCVPLAAKPLENLPGAACLELARWYESLGTSAAAPARLTAMRRAGACYQRYLAVHPEEDLSRLKAELALKEIEKKLEEIDVVNVKVRANLDKERANEEADEHKGKYDALTTIVDKARSDKKALLDGANLPLPGLGVEKG